jgi:hypothetical protein
MQKKLFNKIHKFQKWRLNQRVHQMVIFLGNTILVNKFEQRLISNTKKSFLSLVCDITKKTMCQKRLR